MDHSRLNFVSEPDASLTCCICLEVASQPRQCEDCGKLFCKTCIEKNGNKPCPSCREENPKYFKDVKSAREIMELKVHCFNNERGCEWTGIVRTLCDHIASCQFALVSCPNKCGEDSIMQKEINDHLKECPLRAHECQDCGMKGTYLSMQDHGSVCVAIVACSNKDKGCLASVVRDKLDQHLKEECECTEVSCSYANLGCAVRMMRKDIVKHQENDDKHHLHLALGCICSDKEKVKTLQEDQFFMFKLTEYSTKKKGNIIFESAPFYSHPGGYKMCVVIYPDGILEGECTHLSIRIKILQGEFDESLVWPFQGFVNFELLNQLSNDNHHFATSVYYKYTQMFVGSCKGNVIFLSQSVLSNSPSEQVQYLLDDSLYFRVSVKAMGQRLWLKNEKLSNIEWNISIRESKPIMFKVTCYSVKKAAATYFSSKLFYIYPGLLMQLRFYANGRYNSQNHELSLILQIYGFRDVSVKASVKSVDFTLLNQLEDNKHIYNSLNCQHTHQIGDQGFTTFINIAHSDLSFNEARGTQYLKDDTLYFKVNVNIDICKPWLDGDCFV